EKKRAEIAADIAKKKQQALDAGGLYVIGTERHESRRIDNQLRGRSGRQGDPGRSRFFLSLEDDLMRIFGSERMNGMLRTLGLKDGEAIVHPWINKALERAQGKVEARNFDIRKELLKYDNVMNDQRKVVFEQRLDLMGDDNIAETIRDMRLDVIDMLIARHIPERAYAEQWDADGLKEAVNGMLNLDLPINDWVQEEGIADAEIRERIVKASDEMMARKVARFGPDLMRVVEKQFLLQLLDHLWREHLSQLEALRSVIGFRGYGQREPLNEYKSESFELFEKMLSDLRIEVTGRLSHVELMEQPPEPESGIPEGLEEHHIDPLTGEDEMMDGDVATLPRTVAAADRNPADPATWGKVGRNEPCPCGSGKKYKQCHGKLN
ncbi:MAG TPA: SEC-C metal-binding domain-containing protein, partial [Afifellaceae bacterium]|nr:SEC-C metal-binding domain-containing protein [Afifellaceae bacterium]